MHEVFVCWCEALKCFKNLEKFEKKFNFKILGLKRFEKKRKRSLKKNPTLFTLPLSARVAQLHPAGLFPSGPPTPASAHFLPPPLPHTSRCQPGPARQLSLPPPAALSSVS
jgi:hypothetical protein